MLVQARRLLGHNKRPSEQSFLAGVTIARGQRGRRRWRVAPSPALRPRPSRRTLTFLLGALSLLLGRSPRVCVAFRGRLARPGRTRCGDFSLRPQGRAAVAIRARALMRNAILAGPRRPREGGRGGAGCAGCALLMDSRDAATLVKGCQRAPGPGPRPAGVRVCAHQPCPRRHRTARTERGTPRSASGGAAVGEAPQRRPPLEPTRTLFILPVLRRS